MATANTTKPWTRLWKLWQEADAARGLFDFISQAAGFVVRWLPVALILGSLVGAAALAAIATTVEYVLYFPAAAMFVVGLLLTGWVLRRQTMPVHVDESEVSGDMSEEPQSEKSTDEQQPKKIPRSSSQDRYVSRFDVSWRIERVPMSYSVAALRSVFDPPRDKRRARGPYCPSDRTLLKYKNYDGVRALMDEDDLGTGGSMYCPECTTAFNPDEDYHGKITPAMYRKQIETELNA